MNTVTPIRENLAAYKQLGSTEQLAIVMAVSTLEQMRVKGTIPSEEVIENLLNSTGNPEIALACYHAQLQGIKWRNNQ